MRSVTANAQTLLSQNMGTEFIVLLEVDWVGTNTTVYSDQEFENAKPLVVSITGFDSSMMLSGSSDSQELSITLDDIDGHLRAIYDTHDMHKRPARVYLQHKTLTSTDKILVFLGEVVTPLEWDETQRTMKFNVLSKLQDKQVGFSMEEGDFANIPEEALGKAWPLVFGQVCHLPAVKVRAPRRGYLESGVGIHDFTLSPRICQAVNIQCPSQSTGNQSFMNQGANNSWNTSVQKTVGPDLECVNRRFGEICKLKDLLEQQMAYEYDTVSIYNGTSFPQNQSLELFIDNAVLTGSFSGNMFTITNRKHPEFDTFNHVACRSVPAFGYGSVPAFAQIGGTNNATSTGGYWQLGQGGGAAGQQASATWVPSNNSTTFTATQNQGQAFASCEAALSSAPGMIGGPKDSWKYYDEMEASNFFWAPAGSEVYMESEAEIIYIASLIAGTVDMVCAYRTAPNGFRYLTEVPTDYYSVRLANYQGYYVLEISMDKALTLYDDSWEDQIYVSVTSDVGPNACDIIEWLVGKYTTLSIDATSFAEVKAYLTNYPNNFYMLDRPDVYQLINEIAYQSRCAIYIRNNVVYIRYLSLEPTAIRTVTASDILIGSFQESLSQTEDVYTTHNIKWETGGAAVRADKSTERKIVLKYNVKKYGTVEQDWDYYTYNIYELALKSSTFWLIRKSNSWKKVRFNLPIKHLDLDVLDCIYLDFEQFSATPVKCVIETMTVDPDNNTIALECWTPVRSGEQEQYHWAWPSQQPSPGVWPMPLDTNGGGGYNFEVAPPVGHLLTGGVHRDDQLIITSGDLHPSDLDDTFPSVECEVSDYLNFNEETPDIQAKAIAQSAARAGVETQMSGGGNAGGGGSSKKRSIDGCGVGAGCNYKVTVQWHTSHAQGKATVFGGSKPGGPCGGPCHCSGGCPSCFGPIWSVCHTYGGAGAASSAGQYWENQYGQGGSSWWECNQTGVLGVSVANGTHDPSTTNNGADCSDVGSLTDEDKAEAAAAKNGSGAGEETAEATGQTGSEPETSPGVPTT